MILAPRHALLAVLAGLAVSVGSGCATVGGGAATSLVPTRFETRTGPYVVYTHNALPADAPAVRQLQSLERQVEATLAVKADPGEHPIEIYILGDGRAFDHFLKTYYPELPSRRAFFLAQGDRRVVYTYFNPQLEVDLRHEATHALLHASFADLPLWLDEGLAEYFEVFEERGGVNGEHLGKLPNDLQSGWIPDLARLERIKDVRLMSPRDYRESWAWVHYMLHGPAPAKAALIGYLTDFRTQGEATASLSRRLPAGDDSPSAALATYIGRVREPVTTARLQDSSLTPAALPVPTSVAPVTEPRRSFFARFFDRFRG